MDLENQRRVKEFTEQYGAENIVVLLGAAEGEAAGLSLIPISNISVRLTTNELPVLTARCAGFF